MAEMLSRFSIFFEDFFIILDAIKPPSTLTNAYFKSGIVKENSFNTFLNSREISFEKLREKDDNSKLLSSFSFTLKCLIIRAIA